MTTFPCTRQLLPIVGYTVRFNPDPFPAGETINGWPPWDIDSCLVLAPDPSDKKTKSRKNPTKMKGHKNWEKKRLCHYRKSPEKELPWRSEKIDTANNKDVVPKFGWNRNHAFKGGSTPDLRDNRWILRRPSNLTYFLLASPNLEGEIHFKGGRFVTSQNSKFWNVILNK
jgi:hypothetical protein